MVRDPNSIERGTTLAGAMRLAAFLGTAAAALLGALGAAIAEGERTTTQHQRFIVYSETDLHGAAKLGILDQDAFDKRSAEVAKTNRVLRQAYTAAAKAWNEDPAHKGVQFPMRMPQPLQCSRIATYSTRDKADDTLARRQERLDKKAEEAKKAEERRAAALSESARAKEKQGADLLKAGEALFEAELQRLIGASDSPKGGKPAPKPPAGEGVKKGEL